MSSTLIYQYLNETSVTVTVPSGYSSNVQVYAWGAGGGDGYNGGGGGGDTYRRTVSNFAFVISPSALPSNTSSIRLERSLVGTTTQTITVSPGVIPAPGTSTDLITYSAWTKISSGSSDGRALGGGGGFAQGIINVNSGDTMVISVGGTGGRGPRDGRGIGGDGNNPVISFDGGTTGVGAPYPGNDDQYYGAGGGGGAASAVLVNGIPMIVAAGGGGGGGGTAYQTGSSGLAGGVATAAATTPQGGTSTGGYSVGGAGGGGYPYGGAGGQTVGDDAGAATGGYGGQNYANATVFTSTLSAGSGITPGGATSTFYPGSKRGYAGYNGAVILIFTKTFTSHIKQSGSWKLINRAWVKVSGTAVTSTRTVTVPAGEIYSTDTKTRTFITPGITSWTVPTGVTSVSVTATGAGGPGGAAGAGSGDLVTTTNKLVNYTTDLFNRITTNTFIGWIQPVNYSAILITVGELSTIKSNIDYSSLVGEIPTADINSLKSAVNNLLDIIADEWNKVFAIYAGSTILVKDLAAPSVRGDSSIIIDGGVTYTRGTLRGTAPLDFGLPSNLSDLLRTGITSDPQYASLPALVKPVVLSILVNIETLLIQQIVSLGSVAVNLYDYSKTSVTGTRAITYSGGGGGGSGGVITGSLSVGAGSTLTIAVGGGGSGLQSTVTTSSGSSITALGGNSGTNGTTSSFGVGATAVLGGTSGSDGEYNASGAGVSISIKAYPTGTAALVSELNAEIASSFARTELNGWFVLSRPITNTNLRGTYLYNNYIFVVRNGGQIVTSMASSDTSLSIGGVTYTRGSLSYSTSDIILTFTDGSSASATVKVYDYSYTSGVNGGAGGTNSTGYGTGGSGASSTSGSTSGSSGAVTLTYTQTTTTTATTTRDETYSVTTYAGGWKEIQKGWIKQNGIWKLIESSNPLIPAVNSRAPVDYTTINIVISADTNNYNLIDYLSGYGYYAGRSLINLIVNAGVVVGSDTSGTPALSITGMTAGDIVNVINNGSIIGKGGRGGAAGSYTAVTSSGYYATAQSCFLPGTLVSTPNGYVTIENIQVGDLVYAYNIGPDFNNSIALEPKTVTKTYTHTWEEANKVTPLLIITHSQGELIVTPEHELLCLDKVDPNSDYPGFVRADALAVGDIIYAEDGSELTVTDIANGPEHYEYVYNIEVDDFHTYVADSVRVHNGQTTPAPKGNYVQGTTTINSIPGRQGENGGPALYTTYNITLANNGVIAGGGGGGGGGGGPTGGQGGGGAGTIVGTGANNGTSTAGGAGVGLGGAGGARGTAGSAGTNQSNAGGVGGEAGIAIIGYDKVTLNVEGTILGPRNVG